MSSLTRAHLMDLTGRLVDTVTHPSFLARVEAIQRAADSDSQWTIAQRTDAATLHDDGIALPDGFRVAPRTFENPVFANANGVQPAGREPGSHLGTVDAASYDRSSFPVPSGARPAQAPQPDVIAQHLTDAIAAIADFVTQAPFCALLDEMAGIAAEQRPAFVLGVVLDEQERATRQIVVPPTMAIQRSTFHDGRPTLFCVSASTRLFYPWQKVTITFDNDNLATTAA